MGGALEYVSDLLSGSNKLKKRKQMQTVEVKVRMDCDGCERKVKNAVSSMSGVKSVDVNRKQQKVTVTRKLLQAMSEMLRTTHCPLLTAQTNNTQHCSAKTTQMPAALCNM
eukprot:Gb_20920 [translate_table: standard]